ncbi:hypothetical protein NBRGN_030_00630 [Nocardia brasiliensis NBRC 14402]|nr:hypothetical protein CEQ30_00180 [Nocardia brasiliensis]GAJ80767.1 hypothetical protein NBRGN_030_00630 [Nocardia brasiliensis NBRC 14402]
MEPHHRKLAEIALSVAGDQGFALAGGYAIRVHGMGERPSGDVDLSPTGTVVPTSPVPGPHPRPPGCRAVVEFLCAAALLPSQLPLSR